MGISDHLAISSADPHPKLLLMRTKPDISEASTFFVCDLSSLSHSMR